MHLKSMLPVFEIPKTTPEQQQEIEKWEDEQRSAKHLERLKHSQIPPRFQNANIGECCSAVQAFAEDFDVSSPRGLILTGDVGVGKTHQACAFLNSLLDDYPVRFASMTKILCEVTATFGNQDSELEVISKYINARVLVIDDLGKGNQTEWSAARIFEIIDGRYDNNKPTIITTQYSAQQLAQRLAAGGDVCTADAIVSRLQKENYDSILLKGEDRRMRSLCD